MKETKYTITLNTKISYRTLLKRLNLQAGSLPGR